MTFLILKTESLLDITENCFTVKDHACIFPFKDEDGNVYNSCLKREGVHKCPVTIAENVNQTSKLISWEDCSPSASPKCINATRPDETGNITQILNL